MVVSYIRGKEIFFQNCTENFRSICSKQKLCNLLISKQIFFKFSRKVVEIRKQRRRYGY